MSIANFKEEQRFNQWWIWAILIFSLGGSLIPVYQAFTSPGSTDGSELVATPIITGLMLIVIFGFFKAKLETRVDKYSINYRFVPFIWSWQKIRKEDIVSTEVRKYNPILDFGGWGYRIRIGKKAYTVKGKYAVKIELKNKKKVFIGTQKPEDLERAINKMMNPETYE